VGIDVRSDLVEFGGFAIAFCAAIVAVNEPDELICPFVLTSKNNKRQVIDFESDTQHEAVEKGWASLSDLKNSVDLWAFGREGLFPDGETKFDVVVVSLWGSGMSETISIIQRFRPKREGAFRLIGLPEFIIEGMPLNDAGRAILSPMLFRGIESHPQGHQWVKWQRTDA
jgi:hypothetical protein